jgi:soluble cytochrome b562
MNLQPLQDIRDKNEAKADQQRRHSELLLEENKTQEIIVKSFENLVKYLNGSITKTEVINQLDTIHTPDVKYIIDALNSLHSTLKTHENTDLTELTAVLKQVLDETKQIPKALPAEVTIPEPKDYKDQFTSLENAIKSVEKVVKAQKLIAEAPIVNVPETTVNVEKPDLKPLQKSITEVVNAVNGVVIPELSTTELEKLIKKTNKLLNDLLDKPVSSGGGGGGRATPYETSTGAPYFVVVEADGSIPVTVKNSLTPNVDFDYIDIQQTSATVETYVYKQGGASGTAVQTITVTYTDSNKNDLDKVEYS